MNALQRVGNAANLKALMEQITPSVIDVFPADPDLARIKAVRLVKQIAIAASREPKIYECTVQSVRSCVMELATTGLEPTGAVGGAYVIPYRNSGAMELQVMYDYRGLMDLARRHPSVLSIDADVVFSRDTLDFRRGTDPHLHHVPTLDDDAGTVIAAYAVAQLSDGPAQFRILKKRQIDAAKKRSKRPDKAWTTDYEAMAMKTALRRLCNLLPRSTDLAAALGREDAIERGAPLPLSGTGADIAPPTSLADDFADVGPEPMDENVSELFSEDGGNSPAD